jgi:hypothetical protein
MLGKEWGIHRFGQKGIAKECTDCSGIRLFSPELIELYLWNFRDILYTTVGTRKNGTNYIKMSYTVERSTYRSVRVC